MKHKSWNDHTLFDSMKQALATGALAAPLVMLAGSGFVLVIGVCYAVGYVVVMGPGAMIAMVVFLDTVRAALGKPMAWTPDLLRAVARSNFNTLFERQQSVLVSGNALLMVPLYGGAALLYFSDRARHAYLEARRQAFEAVQDTEKEKLPSRAPIYAMDNCYAQTAHLGEVNKTGEFAASRR